MVADNGVAEVGMPVILQTMLPPTGTKVGGVGAQVVLAQLGNPLIVQVAFAAALEPLFVQAIDWL